MDKIKMIKIKPINYVGNSILIIDDDINRKLAFINYIKHLFKVYIIITDDTEIYEINDIDGAYTPNFKNMDSSHITYFFGEEFLSINKLLIIEKLDSNVIKSKTFCNILKNSKEYNTTVLILDGTNELAYDPIIKTSINYVLFYPDLNEDIQKEYYTKMFACYPSYNLFYDAISQNKTENKYVSVNKNSYRYITSYDKFNYLNIKPDIIKSNVPDNPNPEDYYVEIII